MHQHGSKWTRLNNIYMNASRGGGGSGVRIPHPLKNHKNILAFRWRAYDGPLLVVLGYPHQQNKPTTTKIKRC